MSSGNSFWITAHSNQCWTGSLVIESCFLMNGFLFFRARLVTDMQMSSFGEVLGFLIYFQSFLEVTSLDYYFLETRDLQMTLRTSFLLFFLLTFEFLEPKSKIPFFDLSLLKYGSAFLHYLLVYYLIHYSFISRSYLLEMGINNS